MGMVVMGVRFIKKRMIGQELVKSCSWSMPSIAYKRKSVGERMQWIDAWL